MSTVVQIGIMANAGDAGDSALGTDMGKLWIERGPNEAWHTSLVSDDGQVIVGASGFGVTGAVQLSTDRAVTWSEIYPTGSVASIGGGAIDADGSHILLHEHQGSLWLSTDYGASWNDVHGGVRIDGTSYSFAMNADGSVMYYCDWFKRKVYGGGTWAEITPDLGVGVTKMWYCIACDESGDNVVLGAFSTGGRLYISHDGGGTWAETRPAGDVDRSWEKVSMSNDGQVILASTNSTAYLSVDGGGSWSVTAGGGEAVAVSPDGQYLLSGDEFELYESYDGGSTWAAVGWWSGAVWKDFQYANMVACTDDGAVIAIAPLLNDHFWVRTRDGSRLLFDIKACPGIDSGGSGYPFDIVGCRCE